MYTILKNNDNKYIWDDEEEQMYFVEDNEFISKLPISLQALIKFNPYIETISKQNEIPNEIKEK
jgi:hypothetical protein